MHTLYSYRTPTLRSTFYFTSLRASFPHPSYPNIPVSPTSLSISRAHPLRLPPALTRVVTRATPLDSLTAGPFASLVHPIPFIRVVHFRTSLMDAPSSVSPRFISFPWPCPRTSRKWRARRRVSKLYCHRDRAWVPICASSRIMMAHTIQNFRRRACVVFASFLPFLSSILFNFFFTHSAASNLHPPRRQT